MIPQKLPQRLVYVVDDEEIIASTLASILQKCGFEAASFSNPVRALDAIHSRPPDLLLSDVMMPEMTGIDLAVALRSRCPECKVLLLSGQAGTNNLLEEAQRKGYEFELLSKPVHPSVVIEKTRRLLAS